MYANLEEQTSHSGDNLRGKVCCVRHVKPLTIKQDYQKPRTKSPKWLWMDHKQIHTSSCEGSCGYSSSKASELRCQRHGARRNLDDRSFQSVPVDGPHVPRRTAHSVHQMVGLQHRLDGWRRSSSWGWRIILALSTTRGNQTRHCVLNGSVHLYWFDCTWQSRGYVHQ